MKKSTLFSTTMALAFVAALGMASLAAAQPHMRGYQGMSPEQYTVMQETYADFDRKIQPLRQQMYAKQAELDALYYNNTPQNDPKVQSLMKEIGDLDAKLYAAHGDMRKQMIDKGMPAYGGGMRNGYGCPMMGQGYGGMGHGRGMHGGGMGYGHGHGHGWGR